MQKIYYLSTCDSCKRVMAKVDLPPSFIKIDTKLNPINKEELEDLYDFTKSYEALFNRRARLYQEQNLKEKNLFEEDYKNLILSHYTFLKRPIIVSEDKIFIGSSAKTVDEAKNSIHSS